MNARAHFCARNILLAPSGAFGGANESGDQLKTTEAASRTSNIAESPPKPVFWLKKHANTPPQHMTKT